MIERSRVDPADPRYRMPSAYLEAQKLMVIRAEAS